VAENLKAVYPTDTFIAADSPLRCVSGSVIMDFGGWRVCRLDASSAPSIADGQLKEKAFSCISASKTTADAEQRLEYIADKVKNIFPSHSVNLFMFREGDSTDYFITDSPKGTSLFGREYRLAVLIILI